jgi:hypothetical protein
MDHPRIDHLKDINIFNKQGKFIMDIGGYQRLMRVILRGAANFTKNRKSDKYFQHQATETPRRPFYNFTKRKRCRNGAVLVRADEVFNSGEQKVNFFKEILSTWCDSGEVKVFHNRVPPSNMNTYTTINVVCQGKN